MTQLGKTIQWQTNSGKAVTIGEVSLTPQSRALIVRWPYGGWVWNRPFAVLVEHGGQIARVPIIDLTRVVQLGVFGLSLAFAIITLIRSVQERSNRHE